MGIRGISVVSDSGQLIHLAEIDCLSLLSMFECLHITGAVWGETVRQKRIAQTAVLQVCNIKRHTLSQNEVTQFIEQNNLKDLHLGEQECLCLCRKIDVPLLLTDDLAVRDSAKRLHLTPAGSLGIVVKAYSFRHILLHEAERHITDLYEVSSLFATRAIVELAIDQLHKHASVI